MVPRAPPQPAPKMAAPALQKRGNRGLVYLRMCKTRFGPSMRHAKRECRRHLRKQRPRQRCDSEGQRVQKQQVSTSSTIINRTWPGSARRSCQLLVLRLPQGYRQAWPSSNVPQICAKRCQDGRGLPIAIATGAADDWSVTVQWVAVQARMFQNSPFPTCFSSRPSCRCCTAR